MSEPKSRLAVYPGSFDPLTNGHVDIIRRGARLFDRIVIAILVNIDKSPVFTVEERVDITRQVFEADPTSRWRPSTGSWSTTRPAAEPT